MTIDYMKESKSTALFKTLAPLLVGLLFLLAWDLLVRIQQIPSYLLPSPGQVWQSLINDWSVLSAALWITAQTTFWALGLAVLTGGGLALLMAQSRWIERSLFPYAVVIQTMPIAAISSLIVIWVKNTSIALIICAWMAAVFPIIANTTFGLKSFDPALAGVFQVYRASAWHTLIHLKMPSALPYFLNGLRISGGLALIGAIVAELVAGAGGVDSGIAYQILIAGFNLEIPRMFAALTLTSALGIFIFVVLTLLTKLSIGHWHSGNQL
jgi:NitT/TauT family transport system permease protein